jgi:hypothetical protein
MASKRVNLAVIVGSTATLAASWAGIVAADTRSLLDEADAPTAIADHGLPPLPVSDIAPLNIPDAPSTDIAGLTKIDVAPIAVPQITVRAPAPRQAAPVVRKSRAS